MQFALAYVVIAVYLGLMVAIGLVMQRLNRNADDYFRSGCKATWWLVGASAFMGAFSAWTFSGAAGAAFESGWSVSIIYLANAAGFVINAVWLAPWFRQMRAVTVPQVIHQRFGPVTQQLYAWVNVALGLLYAALWLYGLAIFLASMFGLPINGVVIVVGLVVLIYSVAGGNWAAMSTDFLQALVLIPITLLLAWLALSAVGGWSGFVEQSSRPDLATDFRIFHDHAAFNGQYTLLWAGAMLFKNVIGYNTINSSVRYFSVKDGREARMAAWLGAALMTAGAIVWTIPPMVARMLYADQVNATAISKPAEAAYAVVSMELLPPALIGVMVVAILAATMSSMDTGLNRNAAIFTRDIYPLACRLVGRRPAEGKRLMLLGQAFSTFFGVLIILITLYFVGVEGEGVFEHMLTLGAVLALPLAVPMLMAMFVRRSPSWAAIFCVAVTAVPSSLGLIYKWDFSNQVFCNVGVGAAAYLATIPFWRFETPTYKARVHAFFEQMHRPIDFAREVGAGNDLKQLAIMGWFAVVTGAFLSLLALLTRNLGEAASVLFVGGFVAVIGGLLVYAGRRSADCPKPQPVAPITSGAGLQADTTA